MLTLGEYLKEDRHYSTKRKRIELVRARGMDGRSSRHSAKSRKMRHRKSRRGNKKSHRKSRK